MPQLLMRGTSGICSFFSGILSVTDPACLSPRFVRRAVLILLGQTFADGTLADGVSGNHEFPCCLKYGV